MIMRDRKDLVWIAAASTLILVWGTIPTWAGYRLETETLRFRGLYFDSQDYAVHIAMMQAGMHGEWAYQLKFTTETHEPAYIRMFYVVLGHISRWIGLPAELTFQLARWALGFLALFALYRLMRRVFADPFWARTAFLLAALGSGVGWLQLILHPAPGAITPIDFWLIDAYVFFSLSLFPHFAFVTAALCNVLSLWLDFLEDGGWTRIAWIGLACVLVQFVNPIALVVVDAGLFGATLFAWWKLAEIHRQDLAALLAVAVTQVPLLAYNFIILNNDPLWSRFTAQNQTLSPPPGYYLWGFALFWPAAILGTGAALRTKSHPLAAAAFWILSAFLLAYSPFPIQRRFLQNITVPLAILAAAGLIRLFELAAARNPGMLRWRFSAVSLFVFLASISSIQMAPGQAYYLQTHPQDLYYPAALDDARAWFRENARYNDFVLASEETSQVIAQKAGMRVYLGHEMETLGHQTKEENVQAFFQGQLPELATGPVKWVLYGPLERQSNPDFRPGDQLELVYDVPELQIYRVK